MTLAKSKRLREANGTDILNKRFKIEERLSFESVITSNIKPESDSIITPNIKSEYDSIIPSIKLGRDSISDTKKHLTVEIEDKKPNAFAKVTSDDVYSIPSTCKAPAKWSELYNEVVAMRSKFLSPVDTMGCERIPEGISPNVAKTNPRIFRFQLLVSLMLSSQTKDEVNFQAMRNLHSGLIALGHKDGLSLESIVTLSEGEIDAFILKVGFHRKKAAYIKKACAILQSNFDSDIPKNIKDIVTLPGVGPKMGFLLLQRGWNINDGIGVDVHIHRLAQIWGWVPKSEKPERTRTELESWLPKKFWGEINPLLVGFGQVICVPKASNCDICTLGINKLCKGANKKLLNTPMTDARRTKLLKGRGNLTELIAEIEDLF